MFSGFLRPQWPTAGCRKAARLLTRRHGPHSRADLLPEELPELFAQSVNREILPG
jgi:hypothetical protein